MKIAIVGATGHTGKHLVLQGLERGHSITALARHPDVLDVQSERLTVAATDVLDGATLADAIGGCEAVVSALGVGTSRRPTLLYSHGVTNILKAMAAHGIRKLSVISAAPAGPRSQQPTLDRLVVMPILDRFFGATYTDMRAMEQVLSGSELDWICLRPPRLIDKSATGHYRIDVNQPLTKARTLTFADLAVALLDSLDRTDLYRRCAYVAN